MKHWPGQESVLGAIFTQKLLELCLVLSFFPRGFDLSFGFKNPTVVLVGGGARGLCVAVHVGILVRKTHRRTNLLKIPLHYPHFVPTTSRL